LVEPEFPERTGVKPGAEFDGEFVAEPVDCSAGSLDEFRTLAELPVTGLGLCNELRGELEFVALAVSLSVLSL